MTEALRSNISAIDPDEVARFDAAAAEWWSPVGPARWLHRYNPVRVAYIRDRACQRFHRDPADPRCLAGLRILDIGCGAGVLCEPLAALGAEVVGADPASTLISVAAAHASSAGLTIDYRSTTSDQLADAGERFDLVLAMEVIEHVPDAGEFLRRSAELVRPGGLLILSTLNRTLKSFVQAKVTAEYILRLLPVGAHEWRKFVRPSEVEQELSKHGMHVSDLRGVTLNLFAGALQTSHKTGVNYLITAARPVSGG